jgi:hypothetical protein
MFMCFAIGYLSSKETQTTLSEDDIVEANTHVTRTGIENPLDFCPSISRKATSGGDE